MSVALQWLDAYARAFPLRAERAFTAGDTVIGYHPDRRDSGFDLRAALLDDLRFQGRGQSLDVLGVIVDNAWFPDRRSTVPLHAHLARFASELISIEGHRATVRHDEPASAFGRLARWRWASLALPADLLVAAASVGVAWTGHEMSLVTPALQEVLRRGVADTHVHLSGAMSFAQAWASLVVPRRQQTASPLAQPGAQVPFGSMAVLGERIRQAGVVRLLLGAYLKTAQSGGFSTFLEAAAEALAREHLRVRRVADAKQSILAMCTGLACASEPAPGCPIPSEVLLRDLVSSLRPRGGDPLDAFGPCGSERLGDADERFGDADERFGRDGGLVAALGERQQGDVVQGAALERQNARRRQLPHPRFVAERLGERCTDGADCALGAVRDADAWLAHAGLRRLCFAPRDDGFARLFWQYVRVRCIVFGWLTQAPGTAGLSWFSEHFDRIDALGVKTTFDAALAFESQDVCLDSFEVRRTPSAKAVRELSHAMARVVLNPVGVQADYRRDRDACARGRDACERRPPRAEVGMVLHWVKSHAEPTPGLNATGSRFGDWYKKAMEDAMEVSRLLAADPARLVFVRGADVANRELAVPNWPVIPVLERVRDASLAAARTLRRLASRPVVPGLRLTAHVGEDFRTLCEGLRRVHELIDRGLLRHGDRLGHAIAVGTDVTRWADRAGVVLQRLEDHVDDLAWELGLYESGALECSGGRARAVEARLREAGRQLYGVSLQTDTLIEARRLLLTFEGPSRLGYPQRPRQRPPADTALGVVFAHLYDDDVQSRGLRAVQITLGAAERAFLAAAQGVVRRALSRLEVVVETNPSSNMIVGDTGDMSQHHALGLCPVAPEGARVGVSINDDDPLTFATKLADEFAYTYGMLSLAHGNDAALEWIDRARQAGLRSRFTLPCSADVDLAHELLLVW